MSEQHPKIWRRVDLHVHPPAARHSNTEGFLLEFLGQAEAKGLDIIGLLDHNSVRGYEQLRLEISRLAVLQEAGRSSAAEETMLAEYRRLLSRLLLLPGFELTTREEVYLLALFPPETPAERLNVLLLNLGIPMEKLREGTVETCSPADIPTACAMISQSGGLVVASPKDPARLANLIGEGRVPPGLVAWEIASPSKEGPAVPLPSVWFSAAHCRREHDEGAANRIGERYTEVLLETLSFEALRDLLARRESERLRFPEQERLQAHIAQLRQQGPGQVILYGEVDPTRIYRDVAALANSGGGVLMIGLTEGDVVGVETPDVWSTAFLRSVREQVDPPPQLNLELLRYGGREVIRVEVHAETPPPYVTREGVVYIRQEGGTRPATRQEILELVIAGLPNGAAAAGGVDLPQAGVEIVGAYLRDRVWYYDVRDLRVTSGVTRQRAKGLWAYAIERQEALRQGRIDVSNVLWKGDRGVWRCYRSGDRRVFDLAHRDPNGRVDHLFYGVSEWGLTPRWREVVEAVRPPVEEEVGLTLESGGGGETRPSRLVRRPAASAGARESPTAERSEMERAGVEAPVERPADRPPRVTEVAVPQEEAACEVAPVQAQAESPGTGTPPAEPPSPPAPAAWGGRLPRWRDQAAVERVYWEGGNLFFDLAMRQADNQVRYFRHVHRNQMAGAEGWVDLVRVPLPPAGIEVVRSTVSGEEVLYQFRDMQTGRVDPRVRRKADFPPGSPHAYAIERFHQDIPLDESLVRWWGNLGYLRCEGGRVDLVYRDEEGRDHIYYAAEKALLNGEWKELLRVWNEEGGES